MTEHKVLFLRGFCRLELTGASPQWALNRLSEGRIPFWELNWIDPFTVQLTVLLRHREKAQEQITRAMCRCRSLQTDGLSLRLRPLLRRPVLLLSLLAAAILAAWLSGFVLFYEVTGNHAVPDAAIMRALEDIGVGVGTFGPTIKPKEIKDKILQKLPQLQWITITQSGCRAVVTVREREAAPQITNRKPFSNLVAAKSGVITELSVFSGRALFEVGDAVVKGDVLVTGAVDLERLTILRSAIAEVFALTVSDQTVVMPSEFGQKHYLDEDWRCVWLTIGQKRIKIFGNSGISTTNCDKMIETIPLTLPQGLTLPVALVIETFRPYALEAAPLSQEAAQLLLSAYARAQTAQSMVAGEILSQRQQLQQESGLYVLRTVLQCREMIALPLEADWIKED